MVLGDTICIHKRYYLMFSKYRFCFVSCKKAKITRSKGFLVALPLFLFCLVILKIIWVYALVFSSSSFWLTPFIVLFSRSPSLLFRFQCRVNYLFLNAIMFVPSSVFVYNVGFGFCSIRSESLFLDHHRHHLSSILS